MIVFLVDRPGCWVGNACQLCALWLGEGRRYLIWHEGSSVQGDDIEHGMKLKRGGEAISDLAEEAAGTKLACQSHENEFQPGE